MNCTARLAVWWSLTWLVGSWTCHETWCQEAPRDPTIASPALKQPTVRPDGAQPPTPFKVYHWRVKALVMLDPNHASVILVAEEHTLKLQLKRQSTIPLHRFTFQGVQYEVLDFDSQGVELRPGARLGVR